MQDNTDLVLDTYYGSSGTKEAQQRLRDRVHWMLEQTAGDSVLDIGCSQGLLPILLGRAGYRVLGIDSREDAIREAQAHLVEETDDVQGRVSFRCANLFDLPAEEQFSTVFFGEVLEHLVQPSRAVTAIAALLQDGGRLVLTTPFSLHLDPDHKHTFFLSSVIDLLAPHFDVDEARVLGRYICIVALRRAPTEQAREVDSAALLRSSEAATLALHHELLDREKLLKFLLEEEKKKHRATSKAWPEEFATSLSRGLAQVATALGRDDRVHDLMHLPSNKEKAVHALKELVGAAGDLQAAHTAAVARQELSESLFANASARIRELESSEAALRDGSRVALLEKRIEMLTAAGEYNRRRLRAIAEHPTNRLGGLFQNLLGRTGTNAPAPHVAPRSSKASGSSTTASSARPSEPLKPSLPVRVACILDEFSYVNFQPDCTLERLQRGSWQEQLEERRPDFLLVESAWNGNEGDWKYLITYSEPRDDNPLFALIEYCRTRSIPTVFWNKEDPTNYDKFIDAAARFEYIFTTDANSLERYAEDAPDAVVGVLPFAAQPRLQNPVNRSKLEELGDVCFAGAWYPKHPERFEDLDALLEGSQGLSVDIYDRFHGHPASDKHQFPPQYQKYIRGSLSFEELLPRYKQYKLFLNVNSVKDSPTMFSRRVFELLASGTAVVSGHARGIEETLGADIVPMVRDSTEARAAIHALASDDHARDRMVASAQRRIFGEHTYEHRLGKICSTVGVELVRPAQRVTCVTTTRRPEYVDSLLENFARQRHAEKELFVVVKSDHVAMIAQIEGRAQAMGIDEVKVMSLPEGTSLGQRMNTGIQSGTGEYFAKMDDDDFYDENYLVDSLQALRYSRSDCVGKESFFTYSAGHDQTFLRTPNREHVRTKFVIGPTIVGLRSLFPEVRFGDKGVGEDSAFLRNLQRAGKRLYSASRFGFVKFFASGEDHHTWQITADEYLKNAVPFRDGYAKDEASA